MRAGWPCFPQRPSHSLLPCPSTLWCGPYFTHPYVVGHIVVLIKCHTWENWRHIGFYLCGEERTVARKGKAGLAERWSQLATFACGQLQVEPRLSGFGFWQINETPFLDPSCFSGSPLALHLLRPTVFSNFRHPLQIAPRNSVGSFFALCDPASQLISKTCNFNFVALVLLRLLLLQHITYAGRVFFHQWMADGIAIEQRTWNEQRTSTTKLKLIIMQCDFFCGDSRSWCKQTVGAGGQWKEGAWQRWRLQFICQIFGTCPTGKTTTARRGRAKSYRERSIKNSAADS